MQRSKKIYLAALISLVTIATLTGLYIIVKNEFTPKPLDEKQILTDIITANKSRRNSQDLTNGLSKITNTNEAALSEDTYFLPEPSGYSKTITQYTAGPAVTSCEAYNRFGANSKVEIVFEDFFDGDDYLTKSYIKDADGNYLDYYLHNSEYSYTYLGGKYAVSVPNTAQPLFRAYEAVINSTEESADYDKSASNTDDGVSNEIAIDDSVIEEINFQSYFGEDTKIVGEDMIDNKKVYLIEYHNPAFCNTNEKLYLEDTVSIERDLSDRSNVDLVTKAWVEADTYEYLKQETYYGEIKPEKLLYTESYTNEKDESALYDEVQSKFIFNLDVPIREQTINEYENDNIATLNYIAENDIPLLMVQGSHLSWIYSDKIIGYDSLEYYTDQDFYSETDYGRNAYADVIKREDSYLKTLLNSSFEIEDSYLSINLYENTSVDEAVKKNYVVGELTDTTIVVNNKSISAKKYSETYDEFETNGSAGSDDVSSDGLVEVDNDDQIQRQDEEISYTYNTYIFEYDDFVVLINTSEDLTTLITADFDNESTVDQLLKDLSNQNIALPESAPSSAL